MARIESERLLSELVATELPLAPTLSLTLAPILSLSLALPLPRYQLPILVTESGTADGDVHDKRRRGWG